MSNNLTQYIQYVRDNPKKVKRFEEIARMSAVLLPISRLGIYSEVINEGLYALLANIGSVHDHFIYKQEPSKARSSFSKLLLIIRMVLSFISNSSVCMELYLRQFVGDKICTRFIIVVEWYRVFTKLFLLFAQRNKFKIPLMLTGGQYDASRVANQNRQSKSDEEKIDKRVFWVGKRTGKKFLLPESLKDESNMQKKSSLSGDYAYNCLSIENKANRILSLSAETLNILRPLVYLYHRKWIGWFSSLFLEALCFRLLVLAHLSKLNRARKNVLSQVFDKFRGRGLSYSLHNLDADFRSEAFRRVMLLFLYLLRSPFYEKFTLVWARKLQSGLRVLPLVGKLGNFVEDTLNYYHKAHFYISGS